MRLTGVLSQVGRALRTLAEESTANPPSRQLPASRDGFDPAPARRLDLGTLPPAPAPGDVDFVTGLYHEILGRDPDPVGMQSHLAGLARGVTRAEIRQVFLDSDEYAALQRSGPPESPLPPVIAPPENPAPASAIAADAIDLSRAEVFNSPGDVASWPVTAKLTALDLGPGGVHVDFTRKDGPGSWPDVPFGAPGDSLQYTLWAAVKVGGEWKTSGCIEYWRGLDRNGGPPGEYAKNWYYDANRWGAMTGHQPAPGEEVGFFVTAGDARNHGDALVRERSNVVVVPFPPDGGGRFDFGA
jgi:hypothetical protein